MTWPARGPGIAGADLLILNKTDLAPYVGVGVRQMVRDAEHARAGRPVLALSRTDPDAVSALRAWVLATLWARSRGGSTGPRTPGRWRRTPTPTAPCTPTE